MEPRFGAEYVGQLQSIMKTRSYRTERFIQ